MVVRGGAEQRGGRGGCSLAWTPGLPRSQAQRLREAFVGTCAGSQYIRCEKDSI